MEKPRLGSLHPTRADYQYAHIGDMALGDDFYDDDTETAYNINSAALSESENHLTVFARPRRGMVGQEVISRLQFGTPGITTEDTEDKIFRYHVDDIVPRRQ